MRFSNIFLMVSAAVLLTSDLCGATNAQGDIVSKLGPEMVRSADAFASVKRSLRSHNVDGDDEEERAGGVNAFEEGKLNKMLGDINFAYKKFAKWSKRGWTSNDVYDHVPYKLYSQYYDYRKIAGHAS
ncbi:hypothetical protein F442_20005 [Phytophthora nicotianae P10297]|uniref:RxLR effector protein n=1 Tax=Phytophthora nicotianae P10297 TaxID=1317064 RepID=W2Y8S7_PHYNI|nr:hypothetical protein F442_20005 [Phytophthora nicotianae P10297]